MIAQLQPDMPYLPVDEFARRWGVSERAVRNMIAEGKLPVKRKKPNEKKLYINMVSFFEHAKLDAELTEKDHFFNNF